jgi:ribosomal-protein-alanine N-acetyltransferase
VRTPLNLVTPMSNAEVTSRLRIEPLQARHAPLLFEALADPRIYEYIPDAPHATVDSLIERYAFLEDGAPAGVDEVWLNWALQRLDTAAYIGTLQATVTPDSHASIGYVLTPPAWGEGFATEACRWLVDALRERFVLDEIRASVDVRNHRSLRILERLGFDRAGTDASELRGEATTDFHYRLAREGPHAAHAVGNDGMIGPLAKVLSIEG